MGFLCGGESKKKFVDKRKNEFSYHNSGLRQLKHQMKSCMVGEEPAMCSYLLQVHCGSAALQQDDRRDAGDPGEENTHKLSESRRTRTQMTLIRHRSEARQRFSLKHNPQSQRLVRTRCFSSHAHLLSALALDRSSFACFHGILINI